MDLRLAMENAIMLRLGLARTSISHSLKRALAEFEDLLGAKALEMGRFSYIRKRASP